MIKLPLLMNWLPLFPMEGEPVIVPDPILLNELNEKEPDIDKYSKQCVTLHVYAGILLQFRGCSFA